MKKILVIATFLIAGSVFAQEGFSFQEMQEYNQWKNNFDSREDWIETFFNIDYHFIDSKTFKGVNLWQESFVCYGGIPGDDMILRFEYNHIEQTYTVVMKIHNGLPTQYNLKHFNTEHIGSDYSL